MWKVRILAKFSTPEDPVVDAGAILKKGGQRKTVENNPAPVNVKKNTESPSNKKSE